MGKLATCLVFVLAVGCGSDKNNKVDAQIVIVDAAIDAAPDAFVPDAQQFDFSCMNNPAPTTAPATINLSGTTQEISQGGIAANPMVAINLFKTGVAVSQGNTTSSAAGAWSLNNVATQMMAYDGFLKGAKTGYRTTFVFPPQKINADLANIPVVTMSTATFGTLDTFGNGGNQNDMNDGALFIGVVDCANTPLPDAVLHVTQGGSPVGNDFNLGSLSPMAAGFHVVFNVPAGATEITATQGTTTFPTSAHVITSFKNQQNGTGGQIANGALSTTVLRPGPL